MEIYILANVKKRNLRKLKALISSFLAYIAYTLFYLNKGEK